MLTGVQKKGVKITEKRDVDGIIEVENYTYLGVNIDRNLNFERFISGTISRVNGRLITLARYENCWIIKPL